MAVGIVRRIDELGRIVIPKEMRKTMRLQEGDEMEICASDDGLTLRRYSGFQSATSCCKAVAKLLAKATDKDVLLVSANEVVVAEGKNKKAYQSQRITDSFSNELRKRKEESLQGEEVSRIFESDVSTPAYALVKPVVASGDFLGAVLLLSDSKPSDSDDKYLRFCTELISATFTE